MTNKYGEWVPEGNGITPEDGECCIIAWVFQHESCPYEHYYGYATWNDDSGWDFNPPRFFKREFEDDYDILAWMPTPPFYKEGE